MPTIDLGILSLSDPILYRQSYLLSASKLRIRQVYSTSMKTRLSIL